MKKNIFKYIASALASVFLLSSCLGDLNTTPIDDNMQTADKTYSSYSGYKGVLAKCYASLIQTGQQGGDGGNGDVPGIDEGYSGYTRALFYLQVGSTDEIVLHAGSSKGTRSMLFMDWDASTEIISFTYYRLYMAISYCNEFLRESTESKLKSRGLYEEMRNEYEYMRAEARFIRAYCYTMICDLYGSGPFVEEGAKVGTIPNQKTRKEIFAYIVQEAEEVATLLKDPKTNVYGRVDKAAAWFLLARIYLNAEVWNGKGEAEKAYKYAKKVIVEGNYPLASDYRHIFLADNNTCSEVIWPLAQDEQRAQSSAGTNFMIKALVNGEMNKYFKTGVGSLGWGNARVKTQLLDKFAVSDQTFDESDDWGNKKKDKRAQFFSIGHTKETWLPGKEFQANFNNGYASIKWRNVTKTGQELVEGGTKYSSVDFPLFRTADAYLMAAEAILRGAAAPKTEALSYVNEVRDRAYLSGNYGNNPSGRITQGELSLDFLLDERARELHTELVRRTDLIRFGKFTKGYNWDWKGSTGAANTHTGKDVDNKYNLFPIPQNEFTANPNLTQNPDFN